MTAHAIAGWATLAIVIAVVLVLAAYALALALRLRRIKGRLRHPLLQRIAESAADLRRLESTRARLDELSQRMARAVASLKGVSAEREHLRRECRQAVAGIVGNLRAIRDLLA